MLQLISIGELLCSHSPFKKLTCCIECRAQWHTVNHYDVNTLNQGRALSRCHKGNWNRQEIKSVKARNNHTICLNRQSNRAVDHHARKVCSSVPSRLMISVCLVLSRTLLKVCAKIPVPLAPEGILTNLLVPVTNPTQLLFLFACNILKFSIPPPPPPPQQNSNIS